MTCQGCANSIKTVLEKLPDVNQVDVSLNTACAIIQHDSAKTGVDQLKAAIEDAGFEIID